MKQSTLEGGDQLRSENRKSQSRFSRFLASILAAVLSLAGLVALGPAAYAATPGISTTVLHNNSPIAEGAVVTAGDNLTIRVQYDEDVDSGQPVVIGLPEGVSLKESSLEIPSGNTAIDSIDLVDGKVHISFKDPSEWGVHQGVYDLNFVIDEVENTENKTIEWTVDGDPSSFEVTVRTPGDEQENVNDRTEKSVGWVDLSRFVTVDKDGNVTVDADIVNESINTR